MTIKVTSALTRLNKLLPIKAELDRLNKTEAKVYHGIIQSFYQHGHAPSLQRLETISADAIAIVDRLAAIDMLTLDIDGEIKGCYPFTMEPRVHRVHLNGHEVHAMCALDTLAPSAMFSCASTVRSVCAVSGESVLIQLHKTSIVNAVSVVGLHFGIDWNAANNESSCSDSLCTEMLFLKNRHIAKSWMGTDSGDKEIFNLRQAILFAAAFFVPMMQQGQG